MGLCVGKGPAAAASSGNDGGDSQAQAGVREQPQTGAQQQAQPQPASATGQGRTPAQPEQFQVQPFAVMRLTHEAIRSGMASLVAAAETAKAESASSGSLTRFVNELDSMQSAIDVHAELEDRAFFPMLDHGFDGTCSRAGLSTEHTADQAQQAAIRAAFDAVRSTPTAARADALLTEVKAWAASHEEHLKHEEDVMMPLTQRIEPTPSARGAAMRVVLVHAGGERFVTILLPFILTKLSKLGNPGPVRRFMAGLHASCTPEEYEPMKATARATLEPGLLAKLTEWELMGAGGLEADVAESVWRKWKSVLK